MAHLRIPNSERSIRILAANARRLAKPAVAGFSRTIGLAAIRRTLVDLHGAGALADVETRGFRDRFTPMLSTDCPLLRSYDQWEIFRSRTQFDAFAEMAGFEEKRGQTLALLESMPEGTGDRTGLHEELGIITIAQLLNEFAFHDLGHIRQVMELYRAHVFYPEMGAYQGYYKVNP